MSFLGVLKTIGKVGLAVAKSPLVGLIPGGTIVQNVIRSTGALVDQIHDSTIAAEVLNPGDGQGAAKLSSVMSDFDEWFNSSMEVTNDVLAIRGEKVTYDAALLKQTIDAQVAFFNLSNKLKQSFKIEKVTP